MTPDFTETTSYNSAPETRTEAAQSSSSLNTTRDPIAIIGIGCRFAGRADSPTAFWNLLRDGVDAIVEVPPDRWNIETYYDLNRTRPGKASTRWGGFLDQVDQFDAHFFKISPREAALLDPQQRLLLEVCWEALEDAGQVPERLAGTQVGVFMGAFTLDYKVLQFSESNRHLVDAHTATGAMMTLLANRISYAFDFRGPSISLDTACSSSLVAVHLACQSIWNGESTLAFAGGVNVMVKPEYTIAESKAGMLSADGRSKAFDASANGYVRGEGAGVALLKPLSKALADGDPVYAVIRGTAVNQDGHTPGITVPSSEAQMALLRAAYHNAGVTPAQIQYVEAHGTGTPVGDPLEANAIGAVLSADRATGRECLIGSVKTNIGHTEAAAGIAGLIKTVLSLKHRAIPAHLHLKNPNPEIKFDEFRLRVPHILTPWPETEGLALAGVNSFGFGGTNAHVVLEEFSHPCGTDSPAAQENGMPVEAAKSERAWLLPLSAKSPAALKDMARSYLGFLSEPGEQEDASLADICYTACVRRAHHDHRLALVVHSREEAIEKLEAFLAGEKLNGMASGLAPQSFKGTTGAQAAPRLAFIFSGMGPQWWAMGRQLFEQEPIFRAAVEECDALLRPLSGWSLLKEMLADETQSRMEETEVAQPANFAIQVGLVALWRSWGILPDAIVGHSAGEVAAAYIAGMMSLQEAVRVIFHRSRLQQQTSGMGRLAAVGLPLEEADQVIRGYEDRVSIAAINSPSAVTLVGDPAALEAVMQPLQEKQVFCRHLQVKVPYHSHYMNPLRPELLEALDGLECHTVSLPLFSTVTGKRVTGPDFDAEYWWKNVREPVYFAAAIDEAIREGYTAFVEIGPHPVLSGSISECLKLQGLSGSVLPSLRRHEEERAMMLSSVAELYTQGFELVWPQLCAEGGRFVRLPSYPWQRERYWHESEASEMERLQGKVHPLLGRRLPSLHPSWEVELDISKLPYLDHHRIQDTVVYPGAAYVEMCLAAARQLFGDAATTLEGRDIEFRKALYLPDGATPKLRLTLNTGDSSFDIYSQLNGNRQTWTLHATGKLCQQQKQSVTRRVKLADVRRRCAVEIPNEECYRQFRRIGLEYGPAFRGIERLWQGTGEAIAQIKLPEDVAAETKNYQIHPATLDLCFQVMAAALPFNHTGAGESDTVYMPVSVARGSSVHGQPASAMWIHARLTEHNANQIKGDIQLCDEDGRVIVEIHGCRAVSLKKTERTGSIKEQSLYEFKWEAKPRVNAGEPPSDEAARASGSWLIFADATGVGSALAQQLTARGERCVFVRPGQDHEVVGQGQDYCINPSRPEDFRELLDKALGANKPPCRGVVHLWGLDTPHADETTLDSLAIATTLGSNTVLHLTQALVQRQWNDAPRLWIVTRNAQPIDTVSCADHSIAQAPLWGLARVIGHQEHVDIWGGIVDLPPVALSEEAAVLCDEMWRPDGEDQLAFRNGQRYVARLSDSMATPMPLPPTFCADGSYLITGGMGGLGLLMARWMVERGARRLILLGREALPPRSQWQEAEAGSNLASRIAAIRELELMGASVHIAALDVADEAQLKGFLDQYKRENWPAIRGVIHSAGVAWPQLLTQMDAATFNNVMRPKMYGAWLLHRLLEETPLDFFVLFSSIASVVAMAGQSNYAAGNAFMDVLAHYRQSRGLPALSINWGPWSEVGMATQLDLLEHFERRGLYPMTPEQGLQIFARLLGQNLPQATVVSADWPLVAKWYPNGLAPRMLDQLIARSTETENESVLSADAQNVNFAARLKLAEPEERQSLLESHIQDLVASVLRLNRSRLDPAQPLNSLGLDSMMAIELKNNIETSLGVSLAVVELLKGSSAAQLTVTLISQLQFDEPALDDQEVAQLLNELDQLPLDEVNLLLNKLEYSIKESAS